MQVKTQPFKDALELKGDGISFDVYGSGSKRLGDLCVTKGGLVWCKGPNAKAARDGGINVKWEEFINWVQSRRAAAGKSAAGKPSAQAIASMRVPAQKQASAGSKLSVARSSGIKAPTQAGKLAAQRAAAMKAAAAAKAAGKPASAKNAAPAKSAAKSTSASKLSASKRGTGASKAKIPSAGARKAASMKTSAARRKAN